MKVSWYVSQKKKKNWAGEILINCMGALLISLGVLTAILHRATIKSDWVKDGDNVIQEIHVSEYSIIYEL